MTEGKGEEETTADREEKRESGWAESVQEDDCELQELEARSMKKKKKKKQQQQQ